MPKDKERSINPAQQQRKLDKAKALKKSKSELQARRNEKLARRNPDRIQRQINDLKALESAGDIKPREKAILADLERDLRAVNKAREALGDKAPQNGHPRSRPSNHDQRQPDGVLGKRRHNGQRKHSPAASGSDTDDSVRNIPWPRDTPPPVPKEFRRSKHHQHNGDTAAFGERSYPAPAVPEAPRTTYESAPQLRNLTKEAVNRFVPSAVKRKQDAVKGVGGQLLEPEELDKLEQAGYLQRTTADTAETGAPPAIDTEELKRLEEEEKRFELEIAMHTMESENDASKAAEAGARLQPSRHVEIEEVEDEDL